MKNIENEKNCLTQVYVIIDDDKHMYITLKKLRKLI